jgi:hypothetical protein
MQNRLSAKSRLIASTLGPVRTDSAGALWTLLLAIGIRDSLLVAPHRADQEHTLQCACDAFLLRLVTVCAYRLA